MVGKVKSHTKADQLRFDALKEMGCICCIKMGLGPTCCEIHHITDCGRRMGHQFTLPLCPWHHRGISRCVPADEIAACVGPSLARSKREFAQKFGTELELLEEVNRRLE